MPWVRRKDKPDSKEKILLSVIFLLIGILLAVIFLHFGLNVFRPKKIVEKILPGTTEFTRKKGVFGKNEYKVSINKNTYLGERILFPTPECPDMMVINIKYRPKDPDQLLRKLRGAEGVERADIYTYMIIINRPCVGASEPPLWRWTEVWENIEPILPQHLHISK